MPQLSTNVGQECRERRTAASIAGTLLGLSKQCHFHWQVRELHYTGLSRPSIVADSAEKMTQIIDSKWSAMEDDFRIILLCPERFHAEHPLKPNFATRWELVEIDSFVLGYLCQQAGSGGRPGAAKCCALRMRIARFQSPLGTGSIWPRPI